MVTVTSPHMPANDTSWFIPQAGNQQPEFQVCVASSFEGVHRQHQQLLQYAFGKAGAGDLSRVLVVFAPSGMNDQQVLLSLDERRRVIEQLVDPSLTFAYFEQLPGNDQNAGSSQELSTFFSRIRLLIPGSDLLASSCWWPLLQSARQANVAVDLHFESLGQNDCTHSLRQAVAGGEVKRASDLLGYAYFLKGKVVKGNRIGRTLGYPTANLKPANPGRIIPGQGVYAAMVQLEDKWYFSMVNIGIRPTLDLKNVTIEAHLFNFSREIYNQEISIHFLARIRDEMRFSSLSDLQQQLHHDRESAVYLLQNLEPLYEAAGDLLISRLAD